MSTPARSTLPPHHHLPPHQPSHTTHPPSVSKKNHAARSRSPTSSPNPLADGLPSTSSPSSVRPHAPRRVRHAAAARPPLPVSRRCPPPPPSAAHVPARVQLRRDPNRANGGGQPHSRSSTYQSSTVTYGGINGAYYTASKTRRSGSDGITIEESKEADTTTKEGTHRISRGIHDKGHSVTRKLKSDGKVDSTQILHNLNEDELPGFEESWKGNAGPHLPGWNQNAGISNGDNSGNRGANGARQPAQNWELPGMQQQRDPRMQQQRDPRRRDNGQPKR
uniref:Uncharacterized protein n=1 Tax=Aegilops tauschii subsp. strangulata TaxID=200361 RepID=A0A453G7A4_AEGTS